MRDYAISDDDRATEQEEMARDLAIAAARNFKPEAEYFRTHSRLSKQHMSVDLAFQQHKLKSGKRRELLDRYDWEKRRK